MGIVAEKPWEFVVFRDGDDIFLTYMLGGVVEVPVTVRLEQSEIKEILAGSLQPEALVAQLKTYRETNRNREVVPAIFPTRAQQGAQADGPNGPRLS